ncbi:hypothetical protein Vadar_011473 [Vaccinium darrowii]|uniref:Uncharacterized protein n=1 Tax=Vaccinium darrowii TaxID=229202 RepID=A0ACB7YMZ2_9ERIC|nr:hypothetical protein Vadar_011473 [Vaccinium darrowii]
MTTTDPVNKEMAEQKKEERIVEAELKKREEWERNTAGTWVEATPIGESQSYSTTGERGRSTGMHQMSALPGHGTGSLSGGWWKGGCHPTPSELPSARIGRPRPITQVWGMLPIKVMALVVLTLKGETTAL